MQETILNTANLTVNFGNYQFKKMNLKLFKFNFMKSLFILDQKIMRRTRKIIQFCSQLS